MKTKAVKYICILLGVFIGLSGVLSLAAFALDPQNVYRWNTKGVRYYAPIYSTVAAVKNYDYDYAIIGSSMVQNIDTNRFADELGCKPLKMTVGAMSPSEQLWLFNYANEQGKATDYILCLDLHRFASAASVEPDSGRFPEHMYSDKGIIQFKYLLGFETWLRFIPLNLLLTLNSVIPLPLPDSFADTISAATDINKMCAWDNTKPIGEKKMYEILINQTVAFNEGDDTGFNSNCHENMDYFLSVISEQTDNSETVTIYLPPYSALYWANKTDAERQVLFELRAQIAEFTDKYDNIRLIDLQAKEYTTDLDKYIDFNHHGQEIQQTVEAEIIDKNTDNSFDDISENSAQIEQNASAAKKLAELYK